MQRRSPFFTQPRSIRQPARLWTVRIRLAQLTGLPAGALRTAAETDLFRAVNELRNGKTPELNAALLALASSGLNPDAAHPPLVWDALAAAYAAAGDPSTAGARMTTAANRAQALGHADEAASYRLKAGGFLFQAGKFPEADAVLSLVAHSSAPSPLRTKAGMLRALARGRSAELRLAGASSASFTAALEQQIREFPNDPSTSRLAGCSARRPRQTRSASGPKSSGPPSTPVPRTGSIPAWLSSASIVICSRKRTSAPTASEWPRSQARSQVPLRELQAGAVRVREDRAAAPACEARPDADRRHA